MLKALEKLTIQSEVFRYGVNGVVATVVHYSALRFQIEALHAPSAGGANFVAALFGIATSFLGSRYLVFRRQSEPMAKQAARFFLLYAVIAAIHTSLLFVWTDVFALNYTAGFLIAMVIQVIGSYFGNKRLVFGEG